jgi:hypothetical protein
MVKRNPLKDDPNEKYASVEESRAAIVALSTDDHIKLMIIAGYFCKQRRLGRAQVEPSDLLGEAIARTLNGDRKWRKQTVTMLRHLDRTMESISGHVVEDGVAEAELKGAVSAEELDSQTGLARRSQRADAEKGLLAREQLKEIEALFINEPIAFSVLRSKAEGYTESEITLRLGIGKKGYESARKKIERAMAAYLKKLGEEK